MKKLIATLATAALAAVTLAGCGGDTASDDGGEASTDGGRVTLIGKANASEYWSKVKEGSMAAGEDLGVEVVFNGPDTESEGDKQLNQLDSAINDGPMGIGFAPQDGAQDGAPRLFDAAEAAEIPVIVFDTPLPGSDVQLTTIASDNAGMGAQAAEKMAEEVGSKGKVAIIAHGEVGTAGERRDGFRDWIEENAPDMEVVDVQNGESDPAKSRDKAQGILQAHPDLVGFFGTDDDSVTAIADEVAAKDMDTIVVGIDASPDVLTLLEETLIFGVVVQNPFGMGYRTVEMLVEAADGTLPEETNIISESVWVTPENMNDAE
ncbi:MAG: substrate-binding domain-containing protein, partial [Arachnia sp.]